MSVIGVRELRQRTAEVLKSVREEKAEYIITHQGHPVAMLLPVDAEAMEAAMVEAGKQAVAGGWEAYARLAEQVRRTARHEGQSTQEILDEVRR